MKSIGTPTQPERWCTVQNNFDQAFGRLLESWRHHQQLRAENASFAERLESSSQLMDARIEMAQARRIL